MPGFEIKGYVYVYYPDPETGEYYGDSNEEEDDELGVNERELVLFYPHPDGILKETYPVRDYENVDEVCMRLKALLCQ